MRRTATGQANITPTVLLSRAQRAAVTVATGAVLATLLLLPALRAGVPAYIQDWTWPPDAAGLHAQLLQGWEPWLDDGLGRPNPFPTAIPYFVALAWATPLLSPRVELALLLLVTFAGAFAAATLYARRTFGLGWGAYACGALYVAGPLVLTKLIAGHLSYLQAYAAFPLFALALREGATSRRWCAAGALAAGVTGLQAQFLGFDVAYALIALAFGAAAPRAVLGVGLLSVPLMLPTLLGPTLNAHGGEGILAQQRAVIAWERVQSSGLWEAVTGLGYFTRYVPRLDPTRLVMLLAVAPLLALRGAIAERASPAARTLVMLAVCGWLVVIGFNGPLAPLLDALFTNVTAASLYRELFDVTVLLWFPIAVLAAAGLERLPPLVAAACAAVAAVALVPLWVGYGVYFAPPPSTAALAQVSALVAGDPSPPGRVVWWPALQPIAPAGRGEGGTDPLARTPLGPDMPLYEYQPLGRNGDAVSLAAGGDWRAAAPQFAWLGVRYVVVRDGLVSLASGRPVTVVSPDAALPRVGSSGPFTVYRVPNARALITAEPAVLDDAPDLRRFAPSYSEAIPGPDRIVAAFPYLWRSPAVASCGAGSVIGDGAVLARAGGPWILAARYGDADCAWRPAAELSASPGALFVAGGWSAQPQPRPAPPSAPLASPAAYRERPGHWETGLDLARSGLLVVRVRFDERWHASADGHDLGPPRRWFGFPAWPLSAGHHAIAARYGGEAPVLACLILSLATMAACVVLLLVPERSRAVSPPSGSRR
jgi:hypothetical protein